MLAFSIIIVPTLPQDTLRHHHTVSGGQMVSENLPVLPSLGDPHSCHHGHRKSALLAALKYIILHGPPPKQPPPPFAKQLQHCIW